MTDQLREKVEPNRPSCEQCRKEIPSSAAGSTEAADYVHHFCGAECYAKWLHEKNEKRNIESSGKDD